MFKVNNKDTWTTSMTSLFDVVVDGVFIVNFEHISHLLLVFQFWTGNCILAIYTEYYKVIYVLLLRKTSRVGFNWNKTRHNLLHGRNLGQPCTLHSSSYNIILSPGYKNSNRKGKASEPFYNIPFRYPWKHQKTFGFRMFSGGSKWNIGKKRVNFQENAIISGQTWERIRG